MLVAYQGNPHYKVGGGLVSDFNDLTNKLTKRIKKTPTKLRKKLNKSLKSFKKHLSSFDKFPGSKKKRLNKTRKTRKTRKVRRKKHRARRKKTQSGGKILPWWGPDWNGTCGGDDNCYTGDRCNECAPHCLPITDQSTRAKLFIDDVGRQSGVW